MAQIMSPPNSYIEIPTLDVIDFGDGASLKVPLSHFVIN